MFGGETFVRSTFGVAEPDAVHVELAFKGGIGLVLLAGAFYVGLLWDSAVPRRAFLWWQACLAASDVLFLALGGVMLRAAVDPDPRFAAIGQIAVAAGRLAMRSAFFWVESRSDAHSRSVS
jgi:hypothetical protein